MDDYSELRSRHEDSHILKRLTVLAVCSKGEIGEEQNEVNDHTVSDYQEAFPDLPATSWSGLTDEEKADFEDDGIDIEELGFDDDFEGPKLLEINGERLPLGLEEGDLEKAERILGQIPNDPSAYTEDGFRESSDPSVFGDSDNTVEVEDEQSTEDTSEYVEFSLAENPERVNEVKVKALRGNNHSPERLHVSNIDSLRTIQTALRAETEAENTRNGAMKRLKGRRSALRSDGGDNEESDDEEPSLEEVVKTFDLNDMEEDAVQFRVERGKNSGYLEAAKALQ